MTPGLLSATEVTPPFLHSHAFLRDGRSSFSAAAGLFLAFSSPLSSLQSVNKHPPSFSNHTPSEPDPHQRSRLCAPTNTVYFSLSLRFSGYFWAAFITGASSAWHLETAEDAGPGSVPQPCSLPRLWLHTASLKSLTPTIFPCLPQQSIRISHKPLYSDHLPRYPFQGLPMLLGKSHLFPGPTESFRTQSHLVLQPLFLSSLPELSIQSC